MQALEAADTLGPSVDEQDPAWSIVPRPLLPSEDPASSLYQEYVEHLASLHPVDDDVDIDDESDSRLSQWIATVSAWSDHGIEGRRSQLASAAIATIRRWLRSNSLDSGALRKALLPFDVGRYLLTHRPHYSGHALTLLLRVAGVYTDPLLQSVTSGFVPPVSYHSACLVGVPRLLLPSTGDDAAPKVAVATAMLVVGGSNRHQSMPSRSVLSFDTGAPFTAASLE
jgi:hypothetical protein